MLPSRDRVRPSLRRKSLLDARTLLLVNDNDFGVEGVRTRFWRVEVGADLA